MPVCSVSLDGDQLLAVLGDAEGEIAVGVEIVSDAMQLAGRRGNLAYLSIPVAGDIVKDEDQVFVVRHPRGFLQDGGSGINRFFLAARGIEQHHAAQILAARIKHGSGDRFAVGRPRRIGISRQGELGQHALAASVGVGNDQRRARIGGAVAQIDHLLRRRARS